ncbi:MAG: FHA domain-containing protein [Butyrivibrio sp.]|nr:FHA domain-containing protein [Butyrivibrio sp.]
MKQCSNGHIFDETRYRECPYCNNDGSIGSRPLDGQGDGAFPKTMALTMPEEALPRASAGERDGAFPKTMGLTMPGEALPRANAEKPEEKKEKNERKEMGVTVALNVTESGINPARGWLIITEGDKKGLSFVIHSEKNSIGRGGAFDVNLSFDKSSSKDGDAVVTYDSRRRKFYISPSAGKNNVYHNDGILLQPEEIKDYDTVEIGETKFVFRSLCNEQFTY